MNRLNYLQEIPKNAILVSFDVVGLYPNIPHNERTDIMKVFLNEKSDRLINIESLWRLTKNYSQRKLF